MGRAGRVAQVRYLVDERWGDYYHALDEVKWEAWSAGGEVDPEEARFNLDMWVEPIDHEAAAAAENGRGRRERGRGEDGRDDGSGGSGSAGSTSRARRDDEYGEGGCGRNATGCGGTDTGVTGTRAAVCFGWVVQAAPKGVGLKKRKALLRALADAWTAAAREGGDERPAIRRMAIYRAMKGTLAPKQVAIELKTLGREGLVVVDGDELRCGTEKETQAAATDDTAAAEPGTNVDETRGSRRGAKRGREGAEGHDASEAGDETEDERGGPASGGREARGRRRRRAAVSYAESEHESDSSGADDWT